MAVVNSSNVFISVSWVVSCVPCGEPQGMVVWLFSCNEPSFLAIFRKVHNQTTKPLFSNVVYLSADLRGDRVEGTKLLTLVAVKALYEGRDAVVNLLS